jgi:hypothetical protein
MVTLTLLYHKWKEIPKAASQFRSRRICGTVAPQAIRRRAAGLQIQREQFVIYRVCTLQRIQLCPVQPLPAIHLPIDPLLFIKDNALRFKEIPLQIGVVREARGTDAALAVDDPMPGHVSAIGQAVQSPAHGPRTTGVSQHPRDLPIGGHFAFGDHRNQPVDSGEKITHASKVPGDQCRSLHFIRRRPAR